MRHIVTNQIRTPDGTLLTSFHRHDYKTYIDTVSNETYMVDGGCEYLRRNVNKHPALVTSKYSDDKHEEIREGFYWGTRGVNGDKHLEYKPLKDLDTSHIEAILDTQKHLPEWRIDIFNQELEYRKENNIE